MTVSNSKVSAALAERLASAAPSGVHTALIESVLPTLIDCIADIAKTLRQAHHVSQAGSANAFGDDQLNVDVLAENSIREAIARCPAVATASSEEDPVERPAQKGDVPSGGAVPEEHYTVAFDPLDGSSIIAPNWTVGTIIGIWQGPTALNQPPASKLVASVLGVYGPRTTAFIALRVPGCEPACLEIGIGENGARDCEIVREEVKLAKPPFKTRYFAPANLRVAGEDEKYMKLISHFIENNYSLRYCGGLVPDVVHALVKGHGVYVNPVMDAHKAKLRRLYELYPIALIMECAGGKALDPAYGKRILDKNLEDLNETAGLICGTSEDVHYAKQALLGGPHA
ncbi:Uu.00g119550.m01.CDS01 [Anthostomella pinea]|uniref:Uu.00g119550.m01.CDS01 n=1 Tax=Anthostomella pinea TaxID=933095 RepID=A0AAI8YH55_9PEZI|nr:Uu.00g119550.m01.CDS01 [Anthostomella pinea]